jgi:hypothetical protein
VQVDVRQNNNALLRELHVLLGPSMLDCAVSLPRHKQKKLGEILGLKEDLSEHFVQQGGGQSYFPPTRITGAA